MQPCGTWTGHWQLQPQCQCEVTLYMGTVKPALSNQNWGYIWFSLTKYFSNAVSRQHESNLTVEPVLMTTYYIDPWPLPRPVLTPEMVILALHIYSNQWISLSRKYTAYKHDRFAFVFCLFVRSIFHVAMSLITLKHVHWHSSYESLLSSFTCSCLINVLYKTTTDFVLSSHILENQKWG